MSRPVLLRLGYLYKCLTTAIPASYPKQVTRRTHRTDSTMSSRPKRRAVDETAKRAKRARGETDLQWGLRWREGGRPSSSGLAPVLVLDSPTLPGRDKIAGFDIDWTVIATYSGRKFATGSNDWKWWDESVPVKLRQLDTDGYRVVFFTNQAGIEKGRVQPDTIRTKIEAIVAELGIPVLALVCTGNNHFRKPSTLMWDFVVEQCNDKVAVDLGRSVYVGDAAGRAKEWAKGKPKDFSCSDRMFAANIGVDFATPEEYFLNEATVPFAWSSLDPVQYLASMADQPQEIYHSQEQELVVLVGPPASGKSSFCENHLVPHGYVRVNRDTLGTAAKCMKAAQESLKAGKSVVIDNTSPSAVARSDYIKLAQKAKVACRCFHLQTSLELAHHLNYFRQNVSEGRKRRVPDVGYNVFKKNFEEPSVAEGFVEVKKVNFVPQFKGKKEEEMFKQWTTGGH